MNISTLEIAKLFLKLGTIGFGGPAAHIAMMQREVVQQRGWLSEQEFLDIVGVTHLIPGPNSTEVAIHLGYRMGGYRGLWLAGVCFILPAFLTTTLLAWLYFQWGATPQWAPVMAGIQPAVLAIIVAALWQLIKKAAKRWSTRLLAAGVMLAALGRPWLGVSEVVLLLVASGIGWMIFWWQQRGFRGPDRTMSGPTGIVMWLAALPAMTGATLANRSESYGVFQGDNLTNWLKLGWLFLKVGMVLYGSGYVLIAYLEGGLVDQLQWLTRQQLMDAIAIGQFTPGPILTTASFVGYVVTAQQHGAGWGWLGSLVCTVCIFLPSFLFVLATSPLIHRIRKNEFLSAFLDAVNAASLGLMAGVLVRLAGQVLLFPDGEWSVQFPSLLIAAAACWMLFRWKVPSIGIILAGAVAGALLGWFGLMA